MSYHLTHSIEAIEANLSMYRHAKSSLEVALDHQTGENWRERDDMIIDDNPKVRRLYRAYQEARKGIDDSLQKLEEKKAEETE